MLSVVRRGDAAGLERTLTEAASGSDLQPPGGGLLHGHYLPTKSILQNGGSVFYSLSCRHVER